MDGADFCVRICVGVVRGTDGANVFNAAADGYLAERDIVVYRVGGRVDDTLFIGNRGGAVDDGTCGVVACVGVLGTGVARQ